MSTRLKIVVEKHRDGYVAYPLGISGVVVGQGDTSEEALEDVKSAIKFHLETFGETLSPDESVMDAFIVDATVAVCMGKFPADASKARVVRALEALGFSLIGKATTFPCGAKAKGPPARLPFPNHGTIKASTLRTILTQAGIPREEFLRAYDEN